MDKPDLTAARSALAVPEILRLICELLAKSDQARLLTVSRRFFACAAPLVWSTIYGPLALPGLLPTIDWVRAERTTWDDAWDYDEFRCGTSRRRYNQKRPLDHESLHRFNLYAPHIKQLQPGRWYKKQDAFWKTLLEAVPTRPILPNLQVLTLSRGFSARETNLISHLDAFICPTLTEVRYPGPNNQILSTLVASQLSTRLGQQCPNIRTLDIYTWNTKDNDGKDTLTPKVEPLSSVDLSSSLPQYRNLRCLGGGPELLAPEALVALGSLPLLESFTIVDTDALPEMLVQGNIALPHDAFPALRHLGIYHLDQNGIEQASKLWNLPSLVQQLASVHVSLDPTTASDKQIRHFISSICENSSLVRDLHIDLEPTDGRQVIDLFSPTVISHLQRTSLRALRIVLAPWISLLPVNSFEQLALALSKIEYLDIRCYASTFDDLVLIAKHMPKLRFLGIGLPLSDWPSENELPRSSNSNLALCLAFEYNHEAGPDSESGDVDLDHVKSTSLALYSLWPNGVHCTDWNVLDTYVHDMMNDEIRKLCAPNAFSVPASEDLEFGWKYINRRHIPWLELN